MGEERKVVQCLVKDILCQKRELSRRCFPMSPREEKGRKGYVNKKSRAMFKCTIFSSKLHHKEYSKVSHSMPQSHFDYTLYCTEKELLFLSRTFASSRLHNSRFCFATAAGQPLRRTPGRPEEHLNQAEDAHAGEKTDYTT